MSGDDHRWGTMAMPARHALLCVDPAAYALALGERPELAGAPLVADWARLRRPLIARRGGRAGLVAAGLPLPPAQGKLRIAFELAPAAILSVAPPPLLADAAPAAPASWRPAIAAIVALAARLDVEARVFGALAWASLTGLEYLSATSDIDLLFAVGAGTDVAALLDGLARIEAGAPMRLDGEILRLDRGLAANWRELHGAAGHRTGEVLVKSIEGVALLRRQDFLAPATMAAAS